MSSSTWSASWRKPRSRSLESRMSDDNIIKFPRRPGGGGPEGPMIEQRVARLEQDMGEIKSTLARIEQRLSGIEIELKHLPKASDYATIKGDVARVDGRLQNMPSTLQLVTIILTTWSLGTALIFTMIRFAPR